MANFRSILFVNNIINNILNVMMSLSICFNLRKLLPDGKGSINHAKQFGKWMWKTYRFCVIGQAHVIM